MAVASNYLQSAILNYFLRGQATAQPSQVFLALCINDPSSSDTGTEIAGGGYKRQLVTFGNPVQSGEKSTVTNINKIEFDIATTNWGKITHWGIRDAQTGGRLLCKGAFNRIEDILEGHRFTIEPGNLTVGIE